MFESLCIETRDAPTIAKGLMVKVFLAGCMFPLVLRSDNAKEFVGEVAEELNKLLEIKHITGSAYHPQSQGMVESMHKKVNQIVRGLVQEHPEDWEERMPYCETILRIIPMKVLGGRSPYEVVYGIRPKLPAALDPSKAVEKISVGEYVERLGKYFTESYADICVYKASMPKLIKRRHGET